MLKLKKSLGQNLLVDKNIIFKILNLAKIKNKSILEKKPKKLFLVEKDKRLCEALKSELNNIKNCKI